MQLEFFFPENLKGILPENQFSKNQKKKNFILNFRMKLLLLAPLLEFLDD